MNKKIMEFPVSIYGEVNQVNDVLSKARCRIFYKGANRNGTFINDNFANELISTLHYVPIKGIYENGDYTDHGHLRSEGQIYGIVPMENNFAWEPHLDEDGIVRTYACTDVLLFSALYPEAKEIIGKSQSMELYEPSLEYHTSIYNGQKYIEFEHGSFLGLQVLGDNVEPCFEGASFFSLQQSIQDTIQKIKEYSIGGQSEMPNINFKLSDNDKYDLIWKGLNSNYSEEGNWTVEYCICDIYDDYALTFNIESGSYERVYYTKNDEDNTVTFGDRIPVFVVDVTESENQTLETLRKLNGDTYELVSENLTNADANAQSVAEFNTKIEEMNETISTLNTEIENARTSYSELETSSKANLDEAQAQISSLSEENESLKAYKKAVENQQKEAVVAEYTDKLSEEVLNSYKAKFEEYTAEDLDMHLAYELKKSGSPMFTKEEHGVSGVLPKENPPMSGVEAILAKYKK